MSGPYESSYGGHQGHGGYNQPYQTSYPQQHQYGQGYGQPQGGFAQQQYQQYPPQQQYSAQPQRDFGAPARADSFGPPHQGGFVQGQQGMTFGAYDASNPQGNPGYYGQPENRAYDQYASGHQSQFQQQQQYQQGSQAPLDPNGQPHQFAAQSSDPNAPNYNPNAPPMSEGERGLLGSIGGGVAGHMFGKKSGHGFLGTVGGAIMGNLAEDLFKDKKKKQQHHSGGSSWGGSKW